MNNPLEEFINSLEYDVIVSVERRSIIDLALAIILTTLVIILMLRFIPKN